MTKRAEASRTRVVAPHNTTFKNGEEVWEPWHFTVSAKNAEGVAKGRHSTAHRFTDDEHDWTVNKIAADQCTKPDSQRLGGDGPQGGQRGEEDAGEDDASACS
ncbi:MAG: hypothetical protein Q9183_003454 [Haloplaca sp. 2 TL-2023]